MKNIIFNAWGMCRSRTWHRRLAHVLIVCMTLISPLAACSNTKTVSWREDVKLHDGQVITVDRSEQYRKIYNGGPGLSWLFTAERFQAHFPIPIGDVTWSGPLTPLALDVSSTNVVYLVTVVTTESGEKQYGRMPADEAHVAFKYLGNSQWQEIPISEIPKKFHPNLFVNTDTLFLVQHSHVKTVSLALKAKLDSDPRIVKAFRGW